MWRQKRVLTNVSGAGQRDCFREQIIPLLQQSSAFSNTLGKPAASSPDSDLQTRVRCSRRRQRSSTWCKPRPIIEDAEKAAQAVAASTASNALRPVPRSRAASRPEHDRPLSD
jgi:hypothetical protein